MRSMRNISADLKIEIQKMWNMCAVVVPLVNGSLGIIPMCLAGNLQTFTI